MAQEMVGYRLRKISTGEIVKEWGGTWGQCPDAPNPLIIELNDGEGGNLQVCAPAVGGEYGGHILEAWMMNEPAAPVPQEISDRQFFQQAAISGFISQAEAKAAVKTGDIPAPMQAIVDGIEDADQKFAAEMILSGATVFRRDHALTTAIGVALGKSEAEIDDFFRAAAAL